METVALIKYTVLLVATPIWLPFLKTLWREFRLALREDGGIWGKEPTPRDRQRISDQIAQEPPRQVHIPKGHLGIRRRLAPKAVHTPGPQIGGPRRRTFG